MFLGGASDDGCFHSDDDCEWQPNWTGKHNITSEVTMIRRNTNVYIIIIIIFFLPSVSRIPRDLETEKLEIENVRSDT